MSKKEEVGRKKGLFQIALSGLIGAVIGGAGTVALLWKREMIQDFVQTLEQGVIHYGSMLLIILSLIMYVVGAVFVIRAGRVYKKLDPEDEDGAEALNRKCDSSCGVISLLYIAGVILSGIILGEFNRNVEGNNLISLLLFCTSILWTLGCMDRLVRYQKKINPEKRGNFISWGFQKQWLASCDEREREKIYKASYGAYKVMQYVYMVIFIILILFSSILDVGTLPFVVMGVIWGVQTIAYLHEYQK